MKNIELTGRELRAILKENGLTLSDFAQFMNRNVWYVYRRVQRNRQLSPLMVVQVKNYLDSLELSLEQFLPEQVPEPDLPADQELEAGEVDNDDDDEEEDADSVIDG